MLRWVRAWGLPHRGLGPPRLSFSGVPVAPSSSSGRGGAEPRPVPLSYKLLDGEAARPALVFLHGLFGCKTNFNSVAKALAQQTGRRVLTVDARNHGDSPHSSDMSYEAMSQDLQDLLPQLDLVPCVLIGHSMGGKTAMLLALQRDMAVRQFLLTNLVEVDGRFVWRVNLDALAQHVDKIMAFPPQQESYPGPTLFLLGGNSQFVPCRPCLTLGTGSTPTARRTSWLPFEASWPEGCWPEGTQNRRLQGPVACSTFLHRRTQAGTEGMRVQRWSDLKL
ncbi:protein ABHD11 isoform X5 [Diceros bicornis minor]|uniref:protein ABHD11 isoform X5 n=1 Tax=Diceros bicornis minor TaxID=77932 RepID=UPI0026EA6A67|nr:protein ABHD11 isoform X5 [Diceros bicornis minor]